MADLGQPVRVIEVTPVYDPVPLTVPEEWQPEPEPVEAPPEPVEVEARSR